MLGGTGGTMQKRWCRCVKLGSRFPDLIWTTQFIAARFPCVNLVFACWSRRSCRFRVFCSNKDAISLVRVFVEGSSMEVDNGYHGRCSRNWIYVRAEKIK
ncbi:hypothetical protein DEO72_LG10g1275 [Vigna unguiculata]|uniref:Uncharacterized protein n=1 Tax=Vigna unguiculata TaxID=3917 RepID=A0A4D6NBX0_VIGUN|nr:hypothetical protein DEO72_LG10g1275 [Vigna unguiculata]